MQTYTIGQIDITLCYQVARLSTETSSTFIPSHRVDVDNGLRPYDVRLLKHHPLSFHPIVLMWITD